MLAWLKRCLTCDDSEQEVTTTPKPLTEPLLGEQLPHRPIQLVGGANFYQPPQLTKEYLETQMLAGHLTFEKLKQISDVYEHNRPILDDFICSGHTDHLLAKPEIMDSFIKSRIDFISYRIAQLTEKNELHLINRLEKTLQRLTNPTHCHQPRF